MIYNHIVICGGGFSGVLAAIVAAPHARKVTVLERYTDSEASKYAGKPQSNHVHIMSKKGQDFLEKIIPGILHELRANGASDADWAENTNWHGPFGLSPNYVSGIRSLLFSRKLLDKLLLSRMLRLSNVTYLSAAVKEIVIKNQRVQSIQLSHGEEISNVDLCIDARGRSSLMKESLEKHLGVIPQTTIENTLRYVTTVVDHQFAPSDKVVQYYRQANSTNAPLGYFASPIENNRVIFTTVDYHGNIARPFDQLKSHPLLKNKVVTETSTFTKLHNVHIHYGKAKRWIDNLVIVGDSVCRLNPVYGHGLTICTEQIELLGRVLAKPSFIESKNFQKNVDSIVKEPWSLVKIDEMRASKTPLSLAYRAAHFYMDCIGKSTLHDTKVHKISLEVLHRLRSPWALLSPVVVSRVLLTAIKRTVLLQWRDAREMASGAYDQTSYLKWKHLSAPFVILLLIIDKSKMGR